MSEKRDSCELEANIDPQLLNGIHYTGNKGPCFGARHSIIIMMAIGSSVIFATKTAFSVILVAMISNSTTSNKDIATYDWDNKGVILSSVMWLQIPIQLIAGYWGRKYRHKWFIIGAMTVNSVFFMLIPLFASFGGSVGVMVCRFIEGGATGMLGPIGAGVNGFWVPAEERSKIGMIGMGITFVSAMVAAVASGQIVSSSWGYPAGCYIFGALGLIWSVAWYFLGHQSPATHPRITPEERKYIETSLSTRKTQHQIATPWVKLLTSLYFWAPVVAAIGTSWIDTIMSSVNLLYMNKAWKIDLSKGTSTAALAPFVGMAFGVFLAPLSDFLIKNSYLRVVNARRIFHTVGILGNSVTLLWMTWIPAKSMPLIIANLCIGNVFTIAFSVAGAGLNVYDIAPHLASIISGFSSTISQCVALFAPMTIDWFVKDDSDPAQWRIIFLITAAITTGSAIFFDIFATDKRQWVNQEEDSTEKNKP